MNFRLAQQEICHYLLMLHSGKMDSMRKRHLFNLSVFKGMKKEQQDLLLPLISLCHIPENVIIFNQGETAKYLYILECGMVEIVFKPFDGPAIPVSCITSGGIFGWSSTLGREGYTSTARTLMESAAYRFDGKDLQKLCEKYPETGVVILDRLASAIVERLECTHHEIMSILNQGMELGLNLSEQGSIK
jgi:CRP-like cAMP-binding protein